MADNFETRFDISMLGRNVEVTIIKRQHTGSNYYNSTIKDVGTTRYAGRLAEYTNRSFTFEPVGNADPRVVSWPKDVSCWPDTSWRIEVRVAPPVVELDKDKTRE